MVFKSGEQFNSLAAIALEHGVVNNKYGYAIFSRQRLNFLNCGGTEQQQKPPPCIAAVIQEAIDRIFARKGFTFLAFQQTEPVLVVEQKDKWTSVKLLDTKR